MNKNLNRREFLSTTALATLATAVSPAVWAQEKKVVLAFVGCAHIHTPGFIKLLKGRSDVTVKWVWDHDKARAEKAAKELGATVVTHVNRIWEDSEVAAVVICSETTRHHELVLAAAKARKHMFAEKPLGITAKESNEMAEAIDKSKLLFTTGYFMRTDPKHLFLKDEIARGAFGKITRVRGSNCHEGALAGWFDTEWRWMADPRIAGVGGFGDLGTHKLDILMWLFGDIDSVTAEVRSVTGRYGSVDESGEGLIHFKNEIMGTLAAGWVDIEDPVQLLISGTEAHATIIHGKLHYKKKDKQSEEEVALPRELPAPMHQFVNAIAGKGEHALVTPREAAARVTVMEAMYKGAHKQEWVKIG